MTKTTKTSLLAALALAGLAAAGCGTEDIDRAGSRAPSLDQNGQKQDDDALAAEPTFDHLVIPPREYYDAAMADAIASADVLSLAGAVPVLWVNFDGASLTRGYRKGESFILCRQTATVPAAAVSPAEKDSIVQMVQAHYDATGAGIFVTAAKPTAGDFTTIHVGGSYADLGCAGGGGILGVAPYDKGNANRNDIGYAFTRGNVSARIIAETVAHEAGHSYGLDHVPNRRDLMFASSSPDITGFIAGRAELVRVLGAKDPNATPPPVVPSDTPAPAPTSPAPAPAPAPGQMPIPGLPNLPGGLAGLPGLIQLGNLGQLLPGLGGLLGAGAGGLDLSKLLPQLTALIPGGLAAGQLPGLDKIVALIGLTNLAGQNAGNLAGLGNLANLGNLIPGLGNVGTLANLGQLINLASLTQLAGLANGGNLGALLGGLGGLGNLAQLGTLANLGNLGNLGGLISLAGFGGGNLAALLPALQGLLNNSGGVAIGLPTLPNGAPNLASLLGLLGTNGAGATIPGLLNNFLASAQVINANYTGANKDALLSLLKVAYGQAFTQVASKP